MEKIYNSYENGLAENEIIRLRDEKWSQSVSIQFMDDVIKKGTKVVDIGAGSSVEIENWIRERGGEYLAVDSSNELLDARADSGEQFDVTMLASADDLSKIEDNQFDISHMKLVLMHLPKEQRLRAISEAIRVAKQRAFFLDADWSNWGGTESVDDFVRFIQENINKYRIIDNYIGQKMKSEIEEVASKKGVEVGKIFEFKHEKGDHYHYLISLAKGTYTKLINDRVKDDLEKAELLKQLNDLVGRLEIDKKAGIPIEMASLIGVEVIIEKIKFETLNKEDIREILSIQEASLLSNIKDKSQEDIERNGFFINPLTKEEIEFILEFPESTHAIVYKNEEGIQVYALGFNIGLWKKMRPEQFENLSLKEGFELKDSDYHLVVGSTGKEVGIGMKISKEICRQLQEKGVEIVSGNIAEKPYLNRASITIHKRIGFERFGEITQYKDEQNYVYGLFAKKLK